MVRAKFKVIGIAHPQPDTVSIVLEAVTSGEGNESWSKWTPSGRLEMSVTNPAASDQFALGKEFYLDFSPVTE